MEEQRDARIALDLAPLAALVARVENEAALVEVLQQHDARRRPAVAGHGRERHRVRLVQLGGERLLEPTGELPVRIALDVRLVERFAHVLPAKAA
jgi:hypothetical protein